MAIKDLIPITEMPENLVKVPTFLNGVLLKEVKPVYEEARKSNNVFAFESIDDVAKGSNVPIAGLINKIVAPNFRVAVPTDDIYETIFPMIKGKFYSDLNALDVWQVKPNYDRNLKIWRKVNELAEERLKRTPKSAFRIQGFYCIPNKNYKDYGMKIIPAPNFRVIESDKLSLSSETRFDSLDKEDGMIIPDKNGKFKHYILGNGVSRVYLCRPWHLALEQQQFGLLR